MAIIPHFYAKIIFLSLLVETDGPNNLTLYPWLRYATWYTYCEAIAQFGEWRMFICKEMQHN